jgi:hypothetical protein
MTEPLTCVNHPKVETRLRCARCNAPICPSCARPTPTGYICPACQKGMQKRFENATWFDYIPAILVPGAGALLGSLPVIFIGSIFWGVLLLFYAPFVGSLVARITLRATRRHRSAWLHRSAQSAFIVGGAVQVLIYSSIALFAIIQAPQIETLAMLWPVFFQAVYLALAYSAFRAQLKGIVFRL